MREAKLQAMSNLLWGLAKCGWSLRPAKLAGPAQGQGADITPVLACVMQYVQQRGMGHANAQDWSNLLWALATMGRQADQIAPLITACCKAVVVGTFNDATPQNYANLLWGLAKTGAGKATVQQAFDVLVQAFIRMAHSDKSETKAVTEVAYALEHYGMLAEKQQLPDGLSPAKLAAYMQEWRAPRLK